MDNYNFYIYFTSMQSMLIHQIAYTNMILFTQHVIHRSNNTQQGHNLGPIQQGNSRSLHKQEPIWFHASIHHFMTKQATQTRRHQSRDQNQSSTQSRTARKQFQKSCLDCPKTVSKFQLKLSKNSLEIQYELSENSLENS